MIKIATISTANKGGAGIAAYRLHCSLNQNGFVHSSFINSFSETSINDFIFKETPVVSLPLSFPKKLVKKIYNKIEPLNELFESEETTLKKKINALQLNCEFYSLPYSNYRVEQNTKIQHADLVHLHWVAELLNYPTFFKEVKKPIVWTLHDMNPFQGIFHYKNDELNNSIVSKLDKELFNVKKKAIHQHQNIHIVCLTNWMFEASKNSEILGKYPHYLIPNGLDFNQFNTPFTKSEMKVKYQINNNNRTLLFVSQDIKNPRKGFDLLLSSLTLIAETSFNVITVGNNKIDLPQNFNHIHFNHIDNIATLNELYILADLFLLPSREDNLPNVMLESFANGTPVISFNVGGMKDWIVEKENGLLVPPFSTELFAQELVNFANNKTIFNADNIKKYALKHFDKETQTKNYIELYQAILNK